MFTAQELAALNAWADNNCEDLVDRIGEVEPRPVTTNAARGSNGAGMVAGEIPAQAGRPVAGHPHETPAPPRAARNLNALASPPAPAAGSPALRIGRSSPAVEQIPNTPVAALHGVIDRMAEQSSIATGALRRIMVEQAARGWPDHAELMRLSAWLLRETEDLNNIVFQLHMAAGLRNVPNNL